jgi:N4-gp56 family major capsid protein
MSLEFIPTVWAARLLVALENALIFGQTNVCNRNYEGEVRKGGNTVKIASIGNVAVNNYTRDTAIDEAEVLSDTQQTLMIDQAKYFHFCVDSVDRAQQNVDVLDEAMRTAAWSLKDYADSFLATTMAAGVLAPNTIGTLASPIVLTKDNAYEHLVDLSVKLDENNVPTTERYAIVPPWFHGMLLKDDRFVRSGTLSGDRRLRNGEVGEAAGFTVLKSNKVLNTAGEKYKILAGHARATTYVEQILDVQTYKPEKRFGDAVKGLHVYGAKVIEANSLAMLIGNKG